MTKKQDFIKLAQAQYSQQDLLCAAVLSGIVNDETAELKYLDWKYDQEVYFERVESGYYDRV